MASSKKDLEIMLRLIQEKKEENPGLLGTKDTWEYLKLGRDIHNNASEIVKRLNIRVGSTIQEVTYKASLDRLILAHNGISSSLFKTMFKFPDYKREFYSRGAKLFNINEEADILNKDKIDGVVDFFNPVFMEANLERINSNQDLGSIISGVFEKEFDKYKKKLRKELDLEEYKRALILSLLDFDWTEEGSFFKYLDEKLKSKWIKEIFNVHVIAERVKRDQVEHKLEYRRRLLNHVLEYEQTGEQKNFIEFLFQGLYDDKWSEMVAWYDFKIRNNRRDIDAAIRYSQGEKIEKSAIDYKIEEWEMNDENKQDKIKEYIKREKNKLSNLELIRRMLGQEKNWIKKFLEN